MNIYDVFFVSEGQNCSRVHLTLFTLETSALQNKVLIAAKLA